MRRDSTKTALVWLFCLAMSSGAVAVADSPKPTIMVVPLDAEGDQILGWRPGLGDNLAEMLTIALGKLNKFTVIDSAAHPDWLKAISQADVADDGVGEKLDKIGMTGVDYLFRGKVVRFGAKKQDFDVGSIIAPGSDMSMERTTADVRIDWRIVVVASRALLHSGKALGTKSGRGFKLSSSDDGQDGNIGYDNHDFMKSALGRATELAITNIVTEVAALKLPETGPRQTEAVPVTTSVSSGQLKAEVARGAAGTVLAVPTKGVVIISLGSKQGLKAADTVQVYEPRDTKNAQGEVVFTEEKLVGELTLETVQEERSKATYPGDLEIKTGWIVKGR